jgi:dihydroorotase
LLLTALRYVRGTGRPLMLHLENKSLSLDGVMHEGKWSARTGLRGIPTAAETGPLARDIELIRYAYEEQKRLAAPRGTASADDDASQVPMVHFQHLSCADSVELVRRAKKQGLPVTAEATPAHLLLTDERLTAFDANFKINPPIRSEVDREALIAGLIDGTIDCIGTDHAPHAPQEKEVPLEQANFGSTGLETAFAALHSGLVKTGRVGLDRLIEAMSAAPCRVLGIPEPRLLEGAPADFFVADLDETWEVTPATLRGKSRNCAFLGEVLTGRVRLTVVDGARRFARAQEEA